VMSDFLSRLVDRALARGPRLERRPPSLFESPATGGGIDEVDAESTAPARAAAVAPPPMPVRRPSIGGEPSKPAAAESMIEGRSRAAAEPRHAAPVVDRAAIAPPLVAAPATPQVSRVESHTTHRETIIREIDRHTRHDREVLPVPAADRTVPVEHEIRAVVPAPRSPRADATIVVPPAVRPIAEQAADVLKARNDRSGQASPLARPPLQRRAVETGREVEQPAPPAGPTVTVSIGRVDIRAAQPPAPVPRQRSASGPHVNLDEYLRRRLDGGS